MIRIAKPPNQRPPNTQKTKKQSKKQKHIAKILIDVTNKIYQIKDTMILVYESDVEIRKTVMSQSPSRTRYLRKWTPTFYSSYHNGDYASVRNHYYVSTNITIPLVIYIILKDY